MKFTVHSTDGAARKGTLTLAHGEVETPVFMPVGTYGAVKAMSPAELAENGTRIVTFRDGQVVKDIPVARRRLAKDELAALPQPQAV